MFVSDVMQIFSNMGWANRITMMRIGAVLPILVLIHFPNVYTCWIAMFLFVAAAVTDFLDGYIARREKQVTNFGKFPRSAGRQAAHLFHTHRNGGTRLGSSVDSHHHYHP